MSENNYTGDISVARSYRYQADLHETVYSTNDWIVISNLIAHRMQEHILLQEVEELLDLDEELQQEFWALLLDNCTPFQILVAQQIYAGRNQTEIAKELNVNQTCIHKCLQGNTVYDNGIPHKQGGLAAKLSKQIRLSDNIKRIMKQMYAICPEGDTIHYVYFRLTFLNWEDYLTWLEV